MIDRHAPVSVTFRALLLTLACISSHAQADSPAQSAAEPKAIAGNPQAATGPADPAARAARLTVLAGAVRVQRSDNTGEDTAVLNMPLGEGTRILTGDYGQAEIEFEDGSVARLTPRSALTINLLGLDAAHVAHTELGLLGGLAYFELRKSSGYTWLIEADGIRVTPNENLTVRITLDQPPALVSVLSGQAHLQKPGLFDADVRTGDTLRPGHDGETRYAIDPQLAPESWDAWNESRDESAADAADKRTVARDSYAGDQGYGWSDLDANGNWYNVPGSGQVWQPANADEGFDPYGYGAWVWGNGAYVWASGYAWGWTPYRCGHWQFFSGFGWGWIPDNLCGRWNFAGGGYLGDAGGVFIHGGYPPRHNPIVRPRPTPGQPHPVLPVHGPDGPRPWTPHSGPVKIAGSTAVPLPVVGSGFSRTGSMVGRSLALDFPIDRKTHQPILGTQPGAPAYTNTVPSASRVVPAIRSPRVEGTASVPFPTGSNSQVRPSAPSTGGVAPRVPPAPPTRAPAPVQAPTRAAPSSAPPPASSPHVPAPKPKL